MMKGDNKEVYRDAEILGDYTNMNGDFLISRTSSLKIMISKEMLVHFILL